MSRGNMLLGHARGKVGDLVFSRVNGQQVTRARAAVVKNPQTEPQIIQRIILNTISQAYSRMSTIADHSFEGVAAGQKSMSAFMKKNMSALRQRMTATVNAGGNFEGIQDFSPIGTNNFAINPYILASGSLPQVTVISVASASGAKIAAPSANTYDSMLAKYGLQQGDQLTFVTISVTSEGDRVFEVSRVILDPAGGDLSVPFIQDNAINDPSTRNEGGFVTLSYDSNHITFANGNPNVLAAAVIVSRQKTDGTWQRSNATMVIDSAAVLALVDSYTLQAAIDQFYTDTLDLQSDLYLNNALKKRAAAQSGGGSEDDGGSDPTLSVSTLTIDGQNAQNGQPTITFSTAGQKDITVAISGMTEGKTYTLTRSTTGYESDAGTILSTFNASGNASAVVQLSSNTTFWLKVCEDNVVKYVSTTISYDDGTGD